jgi:hypothetical protein
MWGFSVDLPANQLGPGWRKRAPTCRKWLALSLVVLSLNAGPIRADADPSLSALLGRVAAYVQRFEHNFAVVLSDERYDQRQHVSATIEGTSQPQVPREAGMDRKLQSEMLFMWMPEAREWLIARTVLLVDGVAVRDSKGRLDRALADPDPDQAARLRRLRDEGARFNIGRIRRNFNDPTLALQFLDPMYQSRFTFTRAGQMKVNGVQAWRLAFVEHRHPTLVASNGVDMVAAGSVWVAVSDGEVIRTSTKWTDANTSTTAEIVVNYRRDQKLDMWVPARMDETYAQKRITWDGTPPQVMTVNERIECVATYSNFRRFDTSSHLVLPK